MKKKILTSLFLCCFSLLILVFPNAAIDSANKALAIWWSAVLPSLFPFLVLSSLLNETNSLFFMNKVFGTLTKRGKLCQECAGIMVLGFVAGTPTSAISCGVLQKQNKIDLHGATTLLILSNLIGPMFILGSVGVSMLNAPKLGQIILFCYYSSALICFLIASRSKRDVFLKTNSQINPNINKQRSFNLFELLSSSISNSVSQLLKICGTMMFFCVAFGLLRQSGIIAFLSKYLSVFFKIDPEIFNAIFAGIFEMSMGCKTASALNITLSTKAALCSFIICLGGASIFLQTISFAKINIKRYLKYRILQSGICCAGVFFIVENFYKAEYSFSVFKHPNILQTLKITPLIFSSAACLIFFIVAFKYFLKSS